MPDNTNDNKMEKKTSKKIEKSKKTNASVKNSSKKSSSKEKSANIKKKQNKQSEQDNIFELFTSKNIITDNIEISPKSSKKTKTQSKSNSNCKEKKKAKLKLYKNLNQLIDKNLNQLEYYDLPYSYNSTEVKTIAQNPNTLFIYWDVNDQLIENFKKYYGSDFQDTTIPTLKIYNETMNYSFEVDINDFANSWYLHISNPNSKYRVELARKPKDSYNFNKNNMQRLSSDNGNEYVSTDYIYIACSNPIIAPNNHILFEKFNPNILFRNVKDNSEFYKTLNMLEISNIEKIYTIYDLYKQLYTNDEISINNDIWHLGSSKMPSSQFI